MKTAQDGGQK